MFIFIHLFLTFSAALGIAQVNLASALALHKRGYVQKQR